MPAKQPEPEKSVEEVNVELAAAHVESAVEAQGVAERELAKAENPDAKLCPKCNGPLNPHGNANPLKAGAYHCDNCGICWQHNLKEPRY